LGLRFLFCFFFLPLSSSVLRALSRPQHRRFSHLKPVEDFAGEMSNLTRSNVSREQFLRLIEAGKPPPLTEAIEWIVPADESVPRPPNGCVVWFVAFHERSFSVPADRFIRGVMYAYGLQLQHLNPNNIQ
jgi:hypothetical protein